MKAEERESMLKMVEVLLAEDQRFSSGPLRGEPGGNFMTRVYTAALENVRRGENPDESETFKARAK